MAFDAFLKIGDIEGESSDRAHKGWIEVQTFAWGVRQAAVSGQTGPASGKPQVQNLHCTMPVSRATPQLALACANGKHFPKAELSLQRATPDRAVFLAIAMEDVLVSSYQIAGTASDSECAPLDSIALTIGRIKFEVATRKADGSAGEKVSGSLDARSSSGR